MQSNNTQYIFNLASPSHVTLFCFDSLQALATTVLAEVCYAVI